MTLITGGERRRRWSEEDRSRILAAISEPGAVVADVARREDICTSLVYKWRRAARGDQRVDACGFSPVIIAAAPASSMSPTMSREKPGDLAAQDAASVVIEVELKDVRVRIGAGASSSVIAATLKALRP
ncbi:IS66-like element accessory protein TnpA [Methylocystis sp.]|uniref:IS66-like element accessory protein TnpA n=1 Tax=Methylocystis sp. TaxID=1911079 RepID=UPI003DA3353D